MILNDASLPIEERAIALSQNDLFTHMLAQSNGDPIAVADCYQSMFGRHAPRDLREVVNAATEFALTGAL